jgi:hypothetical protein
MKNRRVDALTRVAESFALLCDPLQVMKLQQPLSQNLLRRHCKLQ